ncbi:hypothetical protein [Limosilactobacillus fermentum]|nr:hypothetical protein [Limosilactobacillus fermentum]
MKKTGDYLGSLADLDGVVVSHAPTSGRSGDRNHRREPGLPQATGERGQR